MTTIWFLRVSVAAPDTPLNSDVFRLSDPFTFHVMNESLSFWDCDP